MLRKCVATMLVVSMMLLVGCTANVHQIGSGPTGTTAPIKQKRWYILWGLIPLNSVDSHAMAGGADNYEIKTQFEAIDVIISIFTSIVSIHPRTVKVTK